VNALLLPFAVTNTLLFMGLGLWPFHTLDLHWVDVLARWPDQVMDGSVASPFLLAIPLGFFWLGAAWPRSRSARPMVFLGVFLGIAVLAALLRLGQMQWSPTLVSPLALLPFLSGIAAGMLLWTGTSTILARWDGQVIDVVWPWLAGAAALAVLLPLDFSATLNTPAWALPDVPQRIYLLIKSAMLWVPVGFLYTLLTPHPASGIDSSHRLRRSHSLPDSPPSAAALELGTGDVEPVTTGSHRTTPRLSKRPDGRGWVPLWGIALALATLLQALPLLGNQPLTEALELLLALPGLWIGAWLGGLTVAHGAIKIPLNRPETTPSRNVAPAPPSRSAHAPLRDLNPAPASLAEAETPDPGDTPPLIQRRAPSPKVQHPHGRSQLPRSLLGAALLLPAMVLLAQFPLWQVGLGLAMLAYAILLWFRPNLWLVIVPAALPLLDLAPWTGRFFFDEFDLLLLVTAGTLYLRGRRWPGLGLTPLWPVLALFSAGLLVSLLQGLGSPPPLDANAFSNYWSGYNSLRVIKGFIWGGLIFMLLRLSRPQPAQLARLLAIGMGIGLLGVGLVGLWERWLFAGFADSHHTYRIVSTFSSMHTGGGHIEAYLAAALPFLWLGLTRWRSALLAVPVMLLTMYVTVFTVARGGVLALGVVLVVLAAASLRQAWRSGRRLQAAIPVGVMAILAAVLLVGIGGGYFQQRLAQTGEDWQIRMNHWQLALGMMDETPMAQLFGMGLGSFPRVYLERGPADKQSATYGFASEGGNTYLRLGTGDTVYYAQRVAVRAGESYHLELEVRSSAAEARISVPVCEKQLLNSRRCVWNEFTVPGDGRWHRLSRDFASGEVGVEDGLKRPPVELYLHHPGQGSVVEVDNVRLLDRQGNNLVGNGGFTWGGDYWFFKTHNHLPWHIKNFWVHLLFEQGWVGLLLFTGLILFALARLGRVAWRGEPLAWVWLASILGMLTVGMFDSLVDTPRLAALLVAFSLSGAAHDWTDPGRPLRRRRASPRPSAGDA
jgi:hypothetical protein